jgi:hypothetical protein
MKHPQEGREAIGTNNWGSGIDPEKLDFVFAIKIPAYKIKKRSKKRDVYLHQDNVELGNLSWGHGTFEELAAI